MNDNLVDEEGLLSHEEQVFYSEIRGLVVVFLFFVILFTIAHLAVQYFAARPDPDLKQDRADRLVHQLVSGICTFTLTISLTGYSLLPFSIAANEVLLGFPHSYYVQWLDTDLLKDLSLIVNLGTKISCLLLPFSYFLLIAQGFTASAYAFSSRLVEAIGLLVFTYILVFGTIWSLGSLIAAVHTLVVGPLNSTSPTTITPVPSGCFASTPGSNTITSTGTTSLFSIQQPVAILIHSIQTMSWSEFVSKCVLHTIVRMLESVQLVASLLGLVLLFACTPIGLVSLGFYLITTSIKALPPNWTTQAALRDRLTELHFDALCLEEDLRTAELVLSVSSRFPSPTRWYDRLSVLTCLKATGTLTSLGYEENKSASYVPGKKFVPLMHNKLPQIHHEMIKLQERISRHVSSPVRLIRDWSRPLVPCLVFAVIFCLLQLTQSYVFFNILDLVWNLIFGGHDELTGRFTNIDASTTTVTEPSTTTVLTPKLIMVGDPWITVRRASTPSFTLGHKPVSAFGHVGAILQICVIHFLLFVSLWGFYATPTGCVLRPRAHTMSLEAIMVNVILLLLFSSALPLQSNLLGLTTMTLPSALKTKDAASTSSTSTPYSVPQETTTPLTSSALEKTGKEYLWWLWKWRAQSTSSMPSQSHETGQRIICAKHCHLDHDQVPGSDSQSPVVKESVGSQPFWSNIWHVFVPVSFYPSVSYVDWTGDLGASHPTPNPNPISNSMPITTEDQRLEDRSIWSQFISRAFGVSSPASASCGLIVVILLYNLCFLITSVWIAGRRLSDATWSFSLELVTSLRCLQQIQWTGTQDGLSGPVKDAYRRTSNSHYPSASSSEPLLNGISCQLAVENTESLFHLPCGE